MPKLPVVSVPSAVPEVLADPELPEVPSMPKLPAVSVPSAVPEVQADPEIAEVPANSEIPVVSVGLEPAVPQPAPRQPLPAVRSQNGSALLREILSRQVK